ncbi:hypothetical protein R0J90_13300, partial [Micrococcus sp. SIMBA_144]
LKNQHVPDVVGKAEVYLGDKEVDTLPIFYQTSVKENDKKSWWKFRAYSFEAITGVRDNG